MRRPRKLPKYQTGTPGMYDQSMWNTPGFQEFQQSPMSKLSPGGDGSTAKTPEGSAAGSSSNVNAAGIINAGVGLAGGVMDAMAVNTDAPSLYTDAEKAQFEKIQKGKRDSMIATTAGTTVGTIGSMAGPLAPVFMGIGAGIAAGGAGGGHAWAEEEKDFAQKFQNRIKGDEERIQNAKRMENMDFNGYDYGQDMGYPMEYPTGQKGGYGSQILGSDYYSNQAGGNYSPISKREVVLNSTPFATEIMRNGGKGGHNAELEGGEVIERAQGRDKHISKSEPSHEKGGTDETLAKGDFVWSDHLKYNGKSYADWYKELKSSRMSDSEKTLAIEDLRDMQLAAAEKEGGKSTTEDGKLYAQTGIEMVGRGSNEKAVDPYGAAYDFLSDEPYHRIARSLTNPIGSITPGFEQDAALKQQAAAEKAKQARLARGPIDLRNADAIASDEAYEEWLEATTIEDLQAIPMTKRKERETERLISLLYPTGTTTATKPKGKAATPKVRDKSVDINYLWNKPTLMPPLASQQPGYNPGPPPMTGSVNPNLSTKYLGESAGKRTKAGAGWARASKYMPAIAGGISTILGAVLQGDGKYNVPGYSPMSESANNVNLARAKKDMTSEEALAGRLVKARLEGGTGVNANADLNMIQRGHAELAASEKGRIDEINLGQAALEAKLNQENSREAAMFNRRMQEQYADKQIAAARNQELTRNAKIADATGKATDIAMGVSDAMYKERQADIIRGPELTERTYGYNHAKVYRKWKEAHPDGTLLEFKEWLGTDMAKANKT